MITVAGLVFAVVVIVVATIMDGNSFGALIGPSSFVLVFGGTLGVAAASSELADLKRLPKALVAAFASRSSDVDRLLDDLMKAAEVARKEGMLAMERQLDGIEDAFLRLGLQQLVDGVDPDTMRQVLDTDIDSLDERHLTAIGMFRSLGGYAPTMGMIGTVIGLISMLGDISDPSQLGTGMALALLTTLYGVIFANLLFLPIGARLARLHEKEMALRQMVVDGILAVQAGAGPRTLIERLEVHLPPAERRGYGARTEQSPPSGGDEVEAA